MSTLTYLTSLVQQAIQRLNNYEANAKKVGELPHQTNLNTASKIPVDRAGISEYITVDQIASAIQNGNYNQLLAIGAVSVNELTNEITVASGVTAQINGSIYQTTTDTTIPITLCPTGFSRKDILVLTTSNTVIAIPGEETDGAIVLAPPVPIDTIYITEFDVNDTAIGTPSDPILGSQFKQKIENLSYTYSDDGENVILPIRGEGQNHYIVDNEDLVSVDGFDKNVLILVRNSEAPYEGKDYLFENKSPNTIQLNHLTSAEIPFSLPNEENLIVPSGGAVWFKFKGEQMAYIMKSWNDPIVSNFKGKFTSKANLETAYPTASDGDYAIVDAGAGSDAIEYIWDNEEGWVEGNSRGASSTDALAEGSINLYFTSARVLAVALSGLSLATGGTIVSTDTVLQAFGKLQKQINDLITSVSGKLDKVTTAGVERVYTINTDGSQGTKSISELSVPFDIIKNYPNQILIQASGNAVNYVGTYAQTITGTQSDLLIGGGGVAYRKVLSAATAGSNANFYDAGTFRVTGTKGFYYRARIKNDDPTNIPTHRFSYGLSGTAIMGNINPSTYTQAMLSFGADNSDSNCQIMYRLNTGSTTKIDLPTMPKSATDEYVIEFWRLEGTTTIHYKVTNLTTSVVIQNSFVFAFAGLALGCFRNNDIATTAVSFAIRRIELYIND